MCENTRTKMPDDPKNRNRPWGGIKLGADSFAISQWYGMMPGR